MLYGGRVTLLGVLQAVTVCTLLGMLLGLSAGTLGGWVELASDASVRRPARRARPGHLAGRSRHLRSERIRGDGHPGHHHVADTDPRHLLRDYRRSGGTLRSRRPRGRPEQLASHAAAHPPGGRRPRPDTDQPRRCSRLPGRGRDRFPRSRGRCTEPELGEHGHRRAAGDRPGSVDAGPNGRDNRHRRTGADTDRKRHPRRLCRAVERLGQGLQLARPHRPSKPRRRSTGRCRGEDSRRRRQS